jgi:hypothetical protein
MLGQNTDTRTHHNRGHVLTQNSITFIQSTSAFSKIRSLHWDLWDDDRILLRRVDQSPRNAAFLIGVSLMSDNLGGLFFFCLADVLVFFFGVPAEPSAFDDTPAAFFRSPPFFFIAGAEEGGDENGSLEVFVMRDKSSGNEVGE